MTGPATTACLIVPIHVDALVLQRATEVVGPALDITRAPWFGTGRDQVLRDHSSDTANVAAAMRRDPVTPNNLYLAPGTHLHWALPDALTHGVAHDPGAGYVARDGLWFPRVPNRWVVCRRVNGTLKDAWLIEGDHVHDWGSGANAAAWPADPDQPWDHPFANVGRQTQLLRGTIPAPATMSLDQVDAPLTAVGPGDPTFAALYTACHSIFGLHNNDLASVPVGYEVLGWYSDAADAPRDAWATIAKVAGRTRHDVIAALLATQDDPPQAVHDITDWPAAQARAAAIAFERHSQWALPDGSTGAASKALAWMFYGKLRINPAPGALPAPVTSRVAIGNSTSEALAALLAADQPAAQQAGFEQALEAVSLDTVLRDHDLDLGAKLIEARHSAGFHPTGKKITWAIRPAQDADRDKDARNLHADLPHSIADLLNLLNIAQDRFDAAEDTRRALLAQAFADWQMYMQAAYPDDDTADTTLDADLLRDAVLARSLDALALATRDATPGHPGSAVAHLAQAHTALNTALDGFVTAHPGRPALVLVPVVGPRFWVANDPVVAIDHADALRATRRHGHDGRARAGGLLECLRLNIAAPPDFGWSAAQLDALMAQIAAAATQPFSAIAQQVQDHATWNPILLEWQAEVQALQPGTNLRASHDCYDPDVITNAFVLSGDGCDLHPVAPGFPVTAPAYATSGRTLLHAHGTDLLASALGDWLDALGSAKRPAPAGLAALDKTLRGAAPFGDRIVSTDLGGFTQGLLMRRVEPQVPVSDPLGFDADQATAQQVRDHVGDPNGLWSADPDAPFMPLRATELTLKTGRVIDSFGQFLPWHPDDVVPAQSLRSDPASPRTFLPPRSAQPARLDFRWLDARGDLVESNDHPASSPVCGWLVPNDFDANVLVYGADGVLLGLVDLTGIWRPAPGNPDAPAGPARIANPHLARVAGWMTRHGSAAFMADLLNVFDTSLAAIDPADYASQNATALLAGRPIAVARASLGLSLQGPAAFDQSQVALAVRIVGQCGSGQDATGQGRADHGFGQIRFPVRLGEHQQLNDGLVGYFIDAGRDDGAVPRGDTLFAPQSTSARTQASDSPIRTATPSDPLPLSRAFDDPALRLTLLLDPRCPVHATCGILPTKAIRIPPDMVMPSLRSIALVLSTMPVLTPPNGVALPLPRYATGQDWAWTALEDGNWTHIPGTPTLHLSDLRAALPGPLPQGGSGPQADLLWQNLCTLGWIVESAPGSARVVGPSGPDDTRLAPDFDGAAVRSLLTRIARSIQPATPVADFGARVVARDGWLTLSPRAAKGPK